MATYEFRCPNPSCPTARFEVRMRPEDLPGAVCPNCGGEAEVVLSAPSVKVRGGTPTFHGRAPRR